MPLASHTVPLRFSVGLPTDHVAAADDFVTGEAVTECARAAEEAGFDACFVTDHPAPDSKWLATGGHHALDPFVALSFAAAVTTRLRVQTHILVLPYRNPLLTAKSVLSLDVLSRGRVILGVAAGYLKPEFAALGVDFNERNELTDEAIDVMRRVWSEDDVAVDGLHFHSRGTTMWPRPTHQPFPPIWIGGNSTAAMRRAVERAEGWVPFPNPAAASMRVRTPPLSNLDELGARLDAMREYAKTVGRATPIDVCFAPFASQLDPMREELSRMEQMGVTWTTVGAGAARTRAEWIDEVQALGEKVVAEYR
jgi:probable F420-dependent oxidoreductase